jgi:hypothetical protein
MNSVKAQTKGVAIAWNAAQIKTEVRGQSSFGEADFSGERKLVAGVVFVCNLPIDLGFGDVATVNEQANHRP